MAKPTKIKVGRGWDPSDRSYKWECTIKKLGRGKWLGKALDDSGFSKVVFGSRKAAEGWATRATKMGDTTIFRSTTERRKKGFKAGTGEFKRRGSTFVKGVDWPKGLKRPPKAGFSTLKKAKEYLQNFTVPGDYTITKISGAEIKRQRKARGERTAGIREQDYFRIKRK